MSRPDWNTSYGDYYLIISAYSLSLPLLSLHLRNMTDASTLAGEKVFGSLSREITLSSIVLMMEGTAHEQTGNEDSQKSDQVSVLKKRRWGNSAQAFWSCNKLHPSRQRRYLTSFLLWLNYIAASNLLRFSKTDSALYHESSTKRVLLTCSF